jgi:hypothetical protein
VRAQETMQVWRLLLSYGVTAARYSNMTSVVMSC